MGDLASLRATARESGEVGWDAMLERSSLGW